MAFSKHIRPKISILFKIFKVNYWSLRFQNKVKIQPKSIKQWENIEKSCEHHEFSVCYINSLLHFLYASKTVREYFKAPKKKEENGLIEAVRDIFKEDWEKSSEADSHKKSDEGSSSKKLKLSSQDVVSTKHKKLVEEYLKVRVPQYIKSMTDSDLEGSSKARTAEEKVFKKLVNEDDINVFLDHLLEDDGLWKLLSFNTQVTLQHQEKNCPVLMMPIIKYYPGRIYVLPFLPLKRKRRYHKSVEDAIEHFYKGDFVLEEDEIKYLKDCFSCDCGFPFTLDREINFEEQNKKKFKKEWKYVEQSLIAETPPPNIMVGVIRDETSANADVNINRSITVKSKFPNICGQAIKTQYTLKALIANIVSSNETSGESSASHYLCYVKQTDGVLKPYDCLNGQEPSYTENYEDLSTSQNSILILYEQTEN